MEDFEPQIMGYSCARRTEGRSRLRAMILSILCAFIVFASLQWIMKPKEVIIHCGSCGAGNSSLQVALKTFQLHMDRFPTQLDELITTPTDTAERMRWNGPYLEDAKTLIDPWGHPYRYRRPGIHRAEYDLWSAGPDGIDGTSDDITIWSQP